LLQVVDNKLAACAGAALILRRNVFSIRITPRALAEITYPALRASDSIF
jgi:hypothetical protein